MKVVFFFYKFTDNNNERLIKKIVIHFKKQNLSVIMQFCFGHFVVGPIHTQNYENINQI